MAELLKRTTLIVRDAQRSLEFYRDVPGLLQFTEPPLAARAAGRSRLGIGDVVFVVQSSDVEAVHRRLREQGARVHAPPHPFEVRGADGRLVRMKSLSFRDPDGYFFEVNERQPA